MSYRTVSSVKVDCCASNQNCISIMPLTSCPDNSFGSKMKQIDCGRMPVLATTLATVVQGLKEHQKQSSIYEFGNQDIEQTKEDKTRLRKVNGNSFPG